MGGMARRTRACAFLTGKYPEAPKRLDHITQEYLQIPVLQAENFFYGPWHDTGAVTLALTDTKQSQRSGWMSSRPIGQGERWRGVRRNCAMGKCMLKRHTEYPKVSLRSHGPGPSALLW